MGYEHKIGAGLCARMHGATVRSIEGYTTYVRAYESQHQAEQGGLAYAGLTHKGGLGARLEIMTETG